MIGDRRYLPETLRPNQLFDALLAAGLAVATIDYRLASRPRSPRSCTTRRRPSGTCGARRRARHRDRPDRRLGRVGRWPPGRTRRSDRAPGRPGGRHRRGRPVQRGRRRRRLVRPRGFDTMPRMPPPPHIAASCRGACTRRPRTPWSPAWTTRRAPTPARSPTSRRTPRRSCWCTAPPTGWCPTPERAVARRADRRPGSSAGWSRSRAPDTSSSAAPTSTPSSSCRSTTWRNTAR